MSFTYSNCLHLVICLCFLCHVLQSSLTPSPWSPKPGYSTSTAEVKRGQSWSGDHTPSYSTKNCDDFTEKSLVRCNSL